MHDNERPYTILMRQQSLLDAFALGAECFARKLEEPATGVSLTDAHAVWAGVVTWAESDHNATDALVFAAVDANVAQVLSPGVFDESVEEALGNTAGLFGAAVELCSTSCHSGGDGSNVGRRVLRREVIVRREDGRRKIVVGRTSLFHHAAVPGSSGVNSDSGCLEACLSATMERLVWFAKELRDRY